MGKSARTGPEASSSRDAFVSSTAKLLRRQGYAGTGLSEIVARSGAPRGSLYFHFPGGKEELARGGMQRAGEQLRRAVRATMDAPGGPRAAIFALLDALAAGLEGS